MKKINAQIIADLFANRGFGYAELNDLAEDIEEWISLNERNRKRNED